MIKAKTIKFKQSGLDWMPEVPEHWQMVRLKYITKYQKGKVPKNFSDDTSLFPYLAMDYLRGKAEVIQYVEPNEELKLVEHDEILVLWDGANAGEVLKSKKGYISSTMAVIEPDETYFLKDFFYYFLKSQEKDLKQLSTGTTIPHLNQDYLFGSHFYSPPKNEQDSIAQYIKTQEEKINLFIQKKQRFIELLKEKRQSIISELLTNGLNSEVKKKYSGVEWVGEIPVHWEIKRLRFIGQCQNGINKGAEYFGTGFPFVSYGDVYNNETLPSEFDGLVVSTEDEQQNYSVLEGDVFFTRTSETVEEIAIASVCTETIPKATFSGFLIRFRPIDNILLPSYSKYYFRCHLHRGFFVKEMNIITRASLNQNLLKNLPVIIPPIDEQKQIAEYIKTETATIDTAIAKAEREIELIREYKEAMIAEAVMGKRK